MCTNSCCTSISSVNLIELTAVGKVKLQVEARTSIIADAVERELLIEVIIENIAHIKLLQFTYTEVGDHTL
jgi:hypothetical protein